MSGLLGFNAPQAASAPQGLLSVPAGTKWPGMIEQGNIDLAARPIVRNKDGSISTVRSIGVNIDGAEVLIPTVSDDGRILSDRQAIDTYIKTGRHLGKFSSPDASTAYAQQLHEQQSRMYQGGGKR